MGGRWSPRGARDSGGSAEALERGEQQERRASEEQQQGFGGEASAAEVALLEGSGTGRAGARNRGLELLPAMRAAFGFDQSGHPRIVPAGVAAPKSGAVGSAEPGILAGSVPSWGEPQAPCSALMVAVSDRADLAGLCPAVFPPVELDGYQLLDSGEGEKLERFGDRVLRRPDPQALWPRAASPRAWADADLTFVRESDRGGRWERRASRRGRGAPGGGADQRIEWDVQALGATFVMRATPFKHVGLFPEQASNWRFLLDRLDERGASGAKLLNLFGYTGAASVLAARAGAEVTHVDASRAAVRWTRDNAERSGLGERGLRLVCEDAVDYARRAARREERYDLILLDPPHYGRGPKGQKWQLETGLTGLLDAALGCLVPGGALILSVYAVGTSPLALANLFEGREGLRVSAGELALEPREGRRRLPCGFCVRVVREG